MMKRDFKKVQDLFIFFKNLNKLTLEGNFLTLVSIIYQNLIANTKHYLYWKDTDGIPFKI